MRQRFLILAVSIGLASCGKTEISAAKVERPAMTFVVGALASNGANTYSGEVRARHEITLGFRVGGKMLSRMVDVGTVIRKGQLIAQLDASDARLQEDAAAAQHMLAESELKRYRDLRKKGFVSQSALDAKETAFKASSAQAHLAGNQAEYATLLADSEGVVTAILAEAGQVVGAGQAIVRIARPGEREVAFSIPESQIANVALGTPAEIELASSQGAVSKYSGRLRELSPAADAVSRTYAARVALNRTDKNVVLGMTATVRIVVGRRSSAFHVPLGAIFQQGEDSAVWLVNQDRSVALRPVSVSAYTDDGALISSGVSPGDRIVSAGVHKLVAGEKIRIIESGTAR